MLRLRKLGAEGEASERRLTADIEIVRLNEDGSSVLAPYGTLQFAPEGLDMPLPMIFDYDADGQHEAIVRYEVERRPVVDATTPLPVLPSVFTFKDGRVSAYERGPSLVGGGASVEQLDNDLRPDVADYGPFVGWLSKGCGVANCPERVTGPRFFSRAVADGSFDNRDPLAKAALQRACQKKPASVVAVLGPSANLKATASNVACARVWQVAPKTIVDELEARRDQLCGATEPCPAFTLLRSWAAATPPVTLEP